MLVVTSGLEITDKVIINPSDSLVNGDLVVAKPLPAPVKAATEGGKTEATKTDSTKTDGAKTDGAKTDGAKTDGSKTDGSKSEGPKAQDNKPQDTKESGAPTTPKSSSNVRSPS